MSFQDAFKPLKIGPLALRNRFIKAATNEGRAKGGIVSKGLVRFHEDIAAGGVAMTTLAYCSTTLDGRTFTDQPVLDVASMADFRVLTDAVHRHGTAACAQITHAGSFTFLDKQTLQVARPLSSSGGFNKVGVMSGRYFKKQMDRADMGQILEGFRSAAIRAREAGFDAVELHMGHGYLLSQFISKLYNKRRDEYGGSIQARMKFPSEVLAAVLEAVGHDMAVLVKFSMTDGPTGNQIADGIEIARRIRSEGAHMAVLSNGMNVESIEAMFGSSLPEAGRGSAPNPVIAVGMWLQSLMGPGHVAFRENYLRELALQIRGAVDMPLAFLGGIQSHSGIDHAIDDGFEAIALGRVLVHDPQFVNKVQADAIESSGCTACNHCVTMMYSPTGTHCILKPDEMDPELNTVPASAR